MKNKKNIMDQLFHERNSSENTQKVYTRAIRLYEKHTQKDIKTLIDTADTEEYNNIRWKNTSTRKHLITYRNHLYNTYNISTAQLYLSAVITTYRHFEITIPPLPYYNTQNAKRTPPINYNDLLDKDILREAVQISSLLVKSIILFLSSSGMSRIDAINLTIQDWLDATKEYHNYNETGNIKYSIKSMRGQDNIIPVFTGLVRQKTGEEYFTFCSHEATKSINEYLLTRTETLTTHQPLFKTHERYFNMAFERLNNHFQLGKVGNYNRLRPHMLRKYHATQLATAGVPTEHIDILQGRKTRGIANEYYIKIKPETILEEYIRALPFLVVDDAVQYRSELERVKDENSMLRENIHDIINRLDSLERDS